MIDTRYKAVATVPQSAIKEIGFGKLKGKSDINPQWRWEVLTETYGMCGLGWKFDVVEIKEVPVEATGEVMLYVKVYLYIKQQDTWSEPIPGYGGDYLIIKDKNGIHGNDEAYKMAVTDALGTAAKMIGVGADIYRGLQDSKVSEVAERERKEKEFDPVAIYKLVTDKATEKNISVTEVNKFLLDKFNVDVVKDEINVLTRDQLSDAYTWVTGYEVDN